jgi:hypothetical protein
MIIPVVGAARWIVDAAADDVRWVRNTTAVGIVIATQAALAALSAIETSVNPHARWLMPLAWVGAFLLLAQRLWALRRGRPVPLLHRIASIGWKLALLGASLHLVYLRYRSGSFAAVDGDEIGATLVAYALLVISLGILSSACTRQQRLRATSVGGILPKPLNLLDVRSPVTGGARGRLVLPPLSRWPQLVACYLLAGLLYTLASTISLLLAGITRVLAYLIPMPNLLLVLGPRLTRPLFESAARWAHMARRYGAVAARDLLAADPRPPVLLLRSFADDNRRMLAKAQAGWSGHGARTFEEVITKRLQPFGPVVAIGRPGEAVPSAGAAREYLSDETWQERVEELIGQALAIVVIAGMTANLGWELQRIESLGATHKLLLVVPAQGTQEAGDRLVTLAHTLRGTRIGQTIRDNLHTDAAVVFLGAQSVVELASTRRLPRDYAVAILLGMGLVTQAVAIRPD